MTLGIEGRDYNVVNGSPVLTPLHDKEVGSTNPWQPLPLYYDKYGKVVNPVAPKEYNDNKSKEIDSEGYFTKGAMNPFLVIHSDTWTQIWPKYTQEWESMAVKAVVGQISMDDYKAYVDKLNANPDFNKAYKEFAQSYKEFFGK
jgi:putative aldouronate transport system substrate-binding protein